ncbi:hypothetical protein BaRGS_00001623 [Batillaria attramentaria]|uniref:Uncharacterized protein n=1 Tax=Batillaria attramentaria TaxID=370345 RepID=A0ABD0M843_9CAEN
MVFAPFVRGSIVCPLGSGVKSVGPYSKHYAGGPRAITSLYRYSNGPLQVTMNPGVGMSEHQPVTQSIVTFQDRTPRKKESSQESPHYISLFTTYSELTFLCKQDDRLGLGDGQLVSAVDSSSFVFLFRKYN